MHTPGARARSAHRTGTLVALAALLAASTACALAAAATAASPSEPARSRPAVAGLLVKAAWIRWLPAGLPAGGYLTLTNSADQPLVLTGASSEAYGEIAFHHNVRADGMSKMALVPSITIPAHSTLDFAASGYHLMLMQPTRAISPGGQLPITLHFSGGGTQSVNFEVRAPNGAAQHEDMKGMSGMPGMTH